MTTENYAQTSIKGIGSNKVLGPDQISVNVLKWLSVSISKPLVKILTIVCQHVLFVYLETVT